MTKKERVYGAIAHKNTDLVPWSFELTSGAALAMREYKGCQDIDACLENHLYRGFYKKNRPLSDGTGNEQDFFGVTWHTSDDGGDVGHIVNYPLWEAEDLSGYTFPEPDYEFAKEVCRTLEEKNTEFFTMFSIGMCYFERAWSLRGMENLLSDMIVDEEFAEDIFAHILEHHEKLLDAVLDYDFDAVYFGDDWGQQRGTITGPDRWRHFIKPGMKRLIQKAKQKGKYVVVHSCGDIWDLMPDLIEMGVDVYNTVQPEIYDLKKLKKEYGKDLTFYGAVSTQQFLPFAKPEEVYEKTCETLDILAKDGGYILSPSHGVTPDIPPENLLAMVRAAKGFSQT